MLPQYHMTIKDLPELERPYEKMEKYGPEVLTDAELLGIIYRTGSKNMRAVEIAQQLLSLERGNSGLCSLYHFSLEELQNVKGIGRVKALQTKAVLELSKRIARQKGVQTYKITSPSSIASIYMEEMRHLKQEHFKVVFLNTKNQIIGDQDITIGSINASIVHPREVFKNAIKKSSTGIIMLHNHPSGDPSPSSEDIRVTKRMVEAGILIGIEVMDHIIIGNGKYVSLKEKQLL